MPKKLAALCVLALCLIFAGSHANAQTKAPTQIKFSLDWKFEGPAAGFLMAKEKGYYQAEGLDVTIDTGNGSNGAVTRVASGAYDIAFADVNSMIEFNVKSPAEQHLRAVFMLYNRPPFALITLKTSGIDDPKKVVGKTLGAPIFDAPRKLFPALAKAIGIDPKSVKWQTMDPPLRLPMLVRGEVEGVTGFDFLTLTLRELGYDATKINVFHYYNFGIELYGNSLMVTKKFADDPVKAEALRGFIRATIKGWQDVIANPADGAKLVKKYDGLVNEKVELDRLQMVLNNNIITPESKANGLGDVQDARMTKAIEQLSDALELTRKLPVNEVFDRSFLPAAAARAIAK